jgi:hypothetical protein
MKKPSSKELFDVVRLEHFLGVDFEGACRHNKGLATARCPEATAHRIENIGPLDGNERRVFRKQGMSQSERAAKLC